MNYTEIAEKHGADRYGIEEASGVYQVCVDFKEDQFITYSKEIERLALRKARLEFGVMGMKESVEIIDRLTKELEE